MGLINLIRKLTNKAIILFKDFLKEALPPAKQIVIGQLKDFAGKVVADVDFKDLSSEEKRKEAVERVLTYAQAHGVKAGNSLVSLVVELAYQKYKG